MPCYAKPLLLISLLFRGWTASSQEVSAGDGALGGSQTNLPPLPRYCAKYAQAYLPSIWTDLLPWTHQGITHEMIKTAANKWTMDMRYPGIAVAFRGGEAFLFKRANLAKTFKHHAKEAIIYMEVFQDLSRRNKVNIPDIDLVLATNDIPAINTARDTVDRVTTYPPQFRYCKSYENPNILVPVWQLYELHFSKCFISYIDTNFTHDPPWEMRTPKVYARLGRWDRHVHPYSRLTYRQGIKVPKNWFARWTKQLRDPRMDVKGLSQLAAMCTRDRVHHAAQEDGIADLPYVPIADWRRNKYLMFVDGITFSSKLEKLLSMGSAVMVEQSGYRSFYQMQLQPFKHYVPFWYQKPQEALDALAWLEQHDEEAHKIAQNAQAWVKEMLNKQALRCYWLTLFREYAKLFKYRPAEVNYTNMPFTWISVIDYLADFRMNKPNYSYEWHSFANKSNFEFEDAFGVPEVP